MTAEVVAALDKAKFSYHDGVFIISAVANALNFDLKSLIRNKTSYT